MKQKGYFEDTQILPDFHFEEAKMLPEYFDVTANDNFILLSISESHVDHLQEKGDDCYSNMKACESYILTGATLSSLLVASTLSMLIPGFTSLSASNNVNNYKNKVFGYCVENTHL